MLPWMWVQNILGTSLRSTSKYWDTLLHYVILYFTKLYCGSIKRTTVKFSSIEKQEQFYTGITQE